LNLRSTHIQTYAKMAAVDKYNLKWNDFESGLLSGFQDIRKSQQFFDVTLICEASQIQAHKVSLSSHNTVSVSTYSVR